MTQTTDADTLPAPAALELEVERCEALTPRMTRLRLTGPDLGEFRFVAGQDLMLAIPTGEGPTGDGSTINRRYTIRRHDSAARAIDLDAVLHGDGPGARWFRSAAPGERVAAFGPRGKVVASPVAAWHLFVGDESGLPAIAAMLEALPADAKAVAVVEVADAREEQPIDAGAEATVTWVHRSGAEPGLPDLLAAAVEALDLPDGPGHAYLAAEMGVVAALRAQLTARGVAPDAVSPKAYWRRGAANAAHGEPLRDRA